MGGSWIGVGRRGDDRARCSSWCRRNSIVVRGQRVLDRFDRLRRRARPVVDRTARWDERLSTAPLANESPTSHCGDADDRDRPAGDRVQRGDVSWGSFGSGRSCGGEHGHDLCASVDSWFSPRGRSRREDSGAARRTTVSRGGLAATPASNRARHRRHDGIGVVERLRLVSSITPRCRYRVRLSVKAWIGEDGREARRVHAVLRGTRTHPGDRIISRQPIGHRDRRRLSRSNDLVLLPRWAADAMAHSAFRVETVEDCWSEPQVVAVHSIVEGLASRSLVLVVVRWWSVNRRRAMAKSTFESRPSRRRTARSSSPPPSNFAGEVVPPACPTESEEPHEPGMKFVKRSLDGPVIASSCPSHNIVEVSAADLTRRGLSARFPPGGTVYSRASDQIF